MEKEVEEVLDLSANEDDERTPVQRAELDTNTGTVVNSHGTRGIAATILLLLPQLPQRAYFAVALRRKGGCLGCRSSLVRDESDDGLAAVGFCPRDQHSYMRKNITIRAIHIRELPTPRKHRKCKESPLGCGRT